MIEDLQKKIQEMLKEVQETDIELTKEEEELVNVCKVIFKEEQ